MYKIPFHPYFTAKDILQYAITLTLPTTQTLTEPYIHKYKVFLLFLKNKWPLPVGH